MFNYSASKLTVAVVVTLVLVGLAMLAVLLRGEFLVFAFWSLVVSIGWLLLRQSPTVTAAACLVAFASLWGVKALGLTAIFADVRRVVLIGLLSAAIAEVWEWFYRRSITNSP